MIADCYEIAAIWKRLQDCRKWKGLTELLNQDAVSRGSQINMEVKFPQLFQWVGLNQDELLVKNRNEAFFSFYKIKKFLELNFFVHFRQ